MTLEYLSQIFFNQSLSTAETLSSYLPKALPDVSTEQIALISTSVALVAIACLARSRKKPSHVTIEFQAKLPAGPPKKATDCHVKTHGHSIKISTQSNLLRIKVSGDSSSLPQPLTEQANRAIKDWRAPFLEELGNSSSTPCRKQFTVSSNLQIKDRYVYEIYYETAPEDLGPKQIKYELKILGGASLFKFFVPEGDHGAGVAKPRAQPKQRTRSWAARHLRSVTATTKRS